jgi:hypothetical protein
VIRPDSRRGKKTIAFWADIAAARQLRRLAADEDRTVQDLMLEALVDLFRKKNLPRSPRMAGLMGYCPALTRLARANEKTNPSSEAPGARRL